MCARFLDLPPEQCVCPDCGQPLRLRSDTEDSEQIEIEVRAYRLKLQRRRYERTCTCEGNRTFTAPPPPKLIPKGRYGISVWVEILLAMIWVKNGVVLLAFCWAHVRRDFIRVGKGWPNLKTWALEWLRRIRVLYRLNDRRLAAEKGSAAFVEADGCLRQAVAEMKTHMESELARADLATPCRKVLESLRAHWDGLTLFVDDPRIPMDNNTSERLARGPAVARKNFYGSGSQWSGQLAAALFSIFATLSMWKLNPRKWLTWYFEQCAAAGGKAPENIQPFLPWNLSEETKRGLRESGHAQGYDTS